jgi:hypothetical protein
LWQPYANNETVHEVVDANGDADMEEDELDDVDEQDLEELV